MAVGLVIHISVGKEKRTEFFSSENIRFGSDESSDLQIHTKKISEKAVWFELEWGNSEYRITHFNEELGLIHNAKPIHRYGAIADGDTIELPRQTSLFHFSRWIQNLP